MPILHKGVYQKTFNASTVPRNMETMTEWFSKSDGFACPVAQLHWVPLPESPALRMPVLKEHDGTERAIAHKFGSLLWNSKALARVTSLTRFVWHKKACFSAFVGDKDFLLYSCFFAFACSPKQQNARTRTASTILDTGARYLSTSSYWLSNAYPDYVSKATHAALPIVESMKNGTKYILLMPARTEMKE